MDQVGMLQAVSALRKARDGDVFVLLAPGVARALLRALPADAITLNDLDVHAHQSALVELLSTEAEEDHDVFWRHFWNTFSPSYAGHVGRLRRDAMTAAGFSSDRRRHLASPHTGCLAPGGGGKELVMPLPAPPGIVRRLVFSRGPGRPFGDDERDTAVLLQPHIADALRVQGRRSASRLLTRRQQELLRLVAAGHDNISIAGQLGLSPATVRKHLENAFTRLEVSSRTEAVAKICPDATWR
jgi:DNA-binding CsgD family transcriptional regulator